MVHFKCLESRRTELRTERESRKLSEIRRDGFLRLRMPLFELLGLAELAQSGTIWHGLSSPDIAKAQTVSEPRDHGGSAGTSGRTQVFRRQRKSLSGPERLPWE